MAMSTRLASRSLMTNWRPSIFPGIPFTANGTTPSSLKNHNHLICGSPLNVVEDIQLNNLSLSYQVSFSCYSASKNSPAQCHYLLLLSTIQLDRLSSGVFCY